MKSHTLRNIATCIATAAFVFVGCSAQAAVITTATGSGADDDVVENTPDNNSGIDRTFLELRSRNVSGSTRHRVAYFKFDLSGLSFTNPIGAASLSFSFNSSTTDADVFNIDVFGVIDGTAGEDTWTPAGLTYNAAPGITTDDYPNPDRDHENVVSLGSVAYPGGNSTAALTLTTTQLTSFLNADTNGFVTILLEAQVAATDEDFFVHVLTEEGFTASEGPLAPTLELAEVPTPATLPAGLAMLGLVAMRRRRMN